MNGAIPSRKAKSRRRTKMKVNQKVRSFMLRSLAVALLISSNVWAQDDAIDWNSLNEEQQRVLTQYQDSWDSLEIERQQRLASGSARWVEMSGEDRVAAQERFKSWRSLSDDQRTNIRQSYQEFRNLPRQDQQRIKT